MSRRRISNSREVKAIWLTVGWADGFKLVWEAGDLGGGEGKKGGKEWEPRGNKPERKESKERGRKRMGLWGEMRGLENPKKPGPRVSWWWRAMGTLGGGFTGQAGGVPVHQGGGMYLGAFGRWMYFDGIYGWASACFI